MTDEPLMQITTTHGLMDVALLERRDSVLDNDVEYTEAVEYWLDGELVHRSVAIALKQGVAAFGEAASLV